MSAGTQTCLWYSDMSLVLRHVSGTQTCMLVLRHVSGTQACLLVHVSLYSDMSTQTSFLVRRHVSSTQTITQIVSLLQPAGFAWVKSLVCLLGWGLLTVCDCPQSFSRSARLVAVTADTPAGVTNGSRWPDYPCGYSRDYPPARTDQYPN